MGMQRRLPPRRDHPLRPATATASPPPSPRPAPTPAPSSPPPTPDQPYRGTVDDLRRRRTRPGTPAHPTTPTAASPSPASPPPSAAPSPEPTTRPPTPSHPPGTPKAHQPHSPEAWPCGWCALLAGRGLVVCLPKCGCSSWLRGGRPLSHPKGTGGRGVFLRYANSQRQSDGQTETAVGETMDNLPRRPQVFQGFPHTPILAFRPHPKVKTTRQPARHTEPRLSHAP